jgi:hypothetical protein
MAAQRAHIWGGERTGHLAHERVVGVRRRADEVHASRGEVDHKHRVIRDEASPRPHLGREEIRPGDRAPMRAQKCLPGRWSRTSICGRSGDDATAEWCRG